MANLGKIKKSGIMSLIKNDICACRTEDAEHPERAGENTVTVFFRNKDGNLTYGKVKKWDNYKLVQHAVDMRTRDRLANCKEIIHRGNIVGAGSLICHVPEDVRPEDVQKFLDGFLQYCIQKFGKENMLMVAEHHHEHRVHSQAYFMPIVVDKKTGQEKLCAKEFFVRSLYQTLHDDLQVFMDKYMGYTTSVILDEGNPKKRKNSKSVNTLKVRALKKEIRQIRKEMKELQKKSKWFSDELAKLEGRLNKIYEEYPETRRVRGSKRQPTAEEMDKRYNIAANPIQVDVGQNKERQRDGRA